MFDSVSIELRLPFERGECSTVLKISQLGIIFDIFLYIFGVQEGSGKESERAPGASEGVQEGSGRGPRWVLEGSGEGR